MAFRPSIPKLLPSADGKTFGIRGWRVFGPGLWNGKPLSPARIAATVDTYRNLKSLIPNYAPKLRLGHDTQQRLAKQLGLTNAGRVIDARLTPDHGIDVDIDGISLTALMTDGKGGFLAFDLEAAIRNGNYDNGLIEMKRQLRHPLDPTQTLLDVFDGIALLGEEHPAVRTTGAPGFHPSADLNRLAFSDFTEDEPVDLQTLAAAIAALPPDQLSQLMAMVQPKPPAVIVRASNPEVRLTAESFVKVQWDAFEKTRAKASDAAPPAIKALVIKLNGVSKEMLVLEKAVDAELHKAIQATEPKAVIPATYSKWKEWLGGHDLSKKDFLTKKWSDVTNSGDAVPLWRGEGDGNNGHTRAHAHHIVMKGEGNFAKQNAEAREILWRNGINPFKGTENLVWAPNWKHSQEYADLVLRKLKQADGRGRVAVVDALSEIAKLFIAGALGKEDAAEGEE